jgi:hypothetical protein
MTPPSKKQGRKRPRCGAIHDSGGYQCQRPRHHKGDHRAPTYVTWKRWVLNVG